MSFTQTNGSIRNDSPYPDNYYECQPTGAPWPSIAAITNSAFPTLYRAPGKTVKVQEGNNVVEYILDMNLNWVKNGGSSKLTAIVYVDTNGNDSTGVVGSSANPFKTMDEALDASSGYQHRTIHIGVGTFASPTWEKIKSNTTFLGSGQPAMNVKITPTTYPNYDNPDPTKLVGGTIFEGMFLIPFDVNNIKGGDFGVDVGSNWVTTNNGGIHAEGFMCSNSNPGNTNTPQNGKAMRTGIDFWNITVLQADKISLVHAFLEENNDRACFTNIVTWGGFAGVVSKSRCTKWKNVTASGSGQYNMILKQNDYAYFYHSTVEGLTIIGGAGLALHNENGDGGLGMQGASVTNAKIIGTSYGVKQIGNRLTGVNLSNIDVVNCNGIGFQFYDIRGARIFNNTVNGATKGFEITGSVDVIGNASRNTTIKDFDLTGVSTSEGILSANNRGLTTGFNYGQSVFTGGGNYGRLLTGVAPAIASEVIALGANYPQTGGDSQIGTAISVVAKHSAVANDTFPNYYSPVTGTWTNGILFNGSASVANPHSLHMYHGRTGQSGMIGFIANNALPGSWTELVYGIYCQGDGKLVRVENGTTAIMGDWTVGHFYLVQIQPSDGHFTIHESSDGVNFTFLHDKIVPNASATYYMAGFVGQDDAIISKPKYN